MGLLKVAQTALPIYSQSINLYCYWQLWIALEILAQPGRQLQENPFFALFNPAGETAKGRNTDFLNQLHQSETNPCSTQKGWTPHSGTSSLSPASLVLSNAFPECPPWWLLHVVTPLETADNLTISWPQYNPPADSTCTTVSKLWEVKQFYHLLKRVRDKLWKHWYWYWWHLCAEAKVINLHSLICSLVANHFSDHRIVCLHISNEKSPQNRRPAQNSNFRYKTSSVIKSWRLILASATKNILLVLLTFQNEILRHFTPKGVHRQEVYKTFCSTLSASDPSHHS